MPTDTSFQIVAGVNGGVQLVCAFLMAYQLYIDRGWPEAPRRGKVRLGRTLFTKHYSMSAVVHITAVPMFLLTALSHIMSAISVDGLIYGIGGIFYHVALTMGIIVLMVLTNQVLSMGMRANKLNYDTTAICKVYFLSSITLMGLQMLSTGLHIATDNNDYFAIRLLPSSFICACACFYITRGYKFIEANVRVDENTPERLRQQLRKLRRTVVSLAVIMCALVLSTLLLALQALLSETESPFIFPPRTEPIDPTLYGTVFMASTILVFLTIHFWVKVEKKDEYTEMGALEKRDELTGGNEFYSNSISDSIRVRESAVKVNSRGPKSHPLSEISGLPPVPEDSRELAQEVVMSSFVKVDSLNNTSVLKTATHVLHLKSTPSNISTVASVPGSVDTHFLSDSVVSPGLHSPSLNEREKEREDEKEEEEEEEEELPHFDNNECEEESKCMQASIV
jgi:hypothetical protein